MEAVLDIPEGFSRHDRKSPLTDPWEPLYRRLSGDTVILGLRAGAAHTRCANAEGHHVKASACCTAHSASNCMRWVRKVRTSSTSGMI